MRLKFDKDRLQALSDGVIAIAITLLVLGIDIPEDHDFTADGLRAFLISMEPGLIAFLTSFVVVSVYWIQHYRIYNVLKHSDRTIMVLNLLFLLPISLAPFASKIKSLYRYDELVMVLFAMVHITTGIILYMTWIYINKHEELLKEEISSRTKIMVSRGIIMNPIICFLALVIGFFNIHIATYLFSLIPISYIWYGKY